MTREQAKNTLPILQAFAEGKTIQLRRIGQDGFDCWEDLDAPSFDIPYIQFYRIKPKPREWIATFDNDLGKVVSICTKEEVPPAIHSRNTLILVREVPQSENKLEAAMEAMDKWQKEPAENHIIRNQEVTHACPESGQSVTPCCGKTPFELGLVDRFTIDKTLVTCKGVLKHV